MPSLSLLACLLPVLAWQQVLAPVPLAWSLPVSPWELPLEQPWAWPVLWAWLGPWAQLAWRLAWQRV